MKHASLALQARYETLCLLFLSSDAAETRGILKMQADRMALRDRISLHGVTFGACMMVLLDGGKQSSGQADRPEREERGRFDPPPASRQCGKWIRLIAS